MFLGLLVSAHLLPPLLPQVVSGFRRRLHQSSNNVTFVAQASFPGSSPPAKSTATLLRETPCQLSGLCARLANINIRQTSDEIITSTALAFTLESLAAGVLTLKTAYTQNGAAVDAPIVISSSVGGGLDCSSAFSSGSRVWTCAASFPAGVAVTLTATAPNTASPKSPLVKTLQVTPPGGLLSWFRTGSN